MSDSVTHRTAKVIALLQEKVRLEPLHRRLFYLVLGILWASGALWLLADWFKEPELGSVRTPLQTLTMKVHGAIMLVYLAMLGTLLTHIRLGTALRANRLSGFSIVALNGILALTGWILYYSAGDALREWSSPIHWAIGLSTPLLLVAHIKLGRGWATGLLDWENRRQNRQLPSNMKRNRNQNEKGLLQELCLIFFHWLLRVGS
jgi:hypothetical protein